METVTKSDIKEILTQLALLRKEVESMKEIIEENDCLLTKEDNDAINEYEQEKKSGTLKSLDQIKKEL